MISVIFLSVDWIIFRHFNFLGCDICLITNFWFVISFISLILPFSMFNAFDCAILRQTISIWTMVFPFCSYVIFIIFTKISQIIAIAISLSLPHSMPSTFNYSFFKQHYPHWIMQFNCINFSLIVLVFSQIISPF